MDQRDHGDVAEAGGGMNMNKVEEADGAGGIVRNINITDLWWRGKIWVAYPGGIVWNVNITYLWWRGKIWVSYPQHQENNQIWILYIFRHSDVNGPS